MSWFYGDWSWVQSTVDLAVVAVLVGFLVWAAIEAVRGDGSSGRHAA